MSKMKTTLTTRPVQRSLFAQEASSEKNANGRTRAAKLSTYLNTREGLWRLLASFPGKMPLTEAIRLAPTVMCNSRKEVAL